MITLQLSATSKEEAAWWHLQKNRAECQTMGTARFIMIFLRRKKPKKRQERLKMPGKSW